MISLLPSTFEYITSKPFFFIRKCSWYFSLSIFPGSLGQICSNNVQMPPNGRDSAYASPLGRRSLHKFGISRIHAILIVRIKEVETRIQFILIIFILPVKTALLAAAPRPLLMNKPSLQNCNERPERSNMAKKSRTFYCAPCWIPKIFYVRWPSSSSCLSRWALCRHLMHYLNKPAI